MQNLGLLLLRRSGMKAARLSTPICLSVKYDCRIRRVLDFIHEHYARSMRLEDLARLAGMSVSTLTHEFRRAVGLAPIAYLIRLRLEKALWMLSHTDTKVSAVAEAVGIRSEHYFYRLFKKHYQLSPRCYVQRHRSVK